MALTVAKSAMEAIREKGLGGFLRMIREEGFLWVEYASKDRYNASQVPAEWHGWLHFITHHTGDEVSYKFLIQSQKGFAINRAQLSFGPIGWLMISEIFPLKLRGRGISIAVLVNFGTNALVTFAFSPLKVKDSRIKTALEEHVLSFN